MITHKKAKYVEGYVVRVGKYSLDISVGTYDNLMDRIDSHKDIKPELFGFMLGKAIPVYERVVCEVCKKPIKEKEEYQTSFGDTIYSTVSLHKKCKEKAEEEKEKSIKGA